MQHMEMKSQTQNIEDMNLVLPPSTTLRLTNIFKSYLRKIMSEEWDTLQSGSIDETTEDLIVQMCLAIIQVLTYSIKQVVIHHSLRISHGCQESWTSFVAKEQQVMDALEDKIALAFAEAVGFPDFVCHENTKKITCLVAKEVTNNLNIKLRTPGGSDYIHERSRLLSRIKPAGGKKRMVRYFTKLLQKFANKIRKLFCSKKDQNEERSTVADLTSEKGPESQDHTLVSHKTPVIPMEQASSQSSTSSAGIQVIKSILDKMANNICETTTDDLPAEELIRIKSINSLDTMKIASEIFSVIEEEHDVETEVPTNEEPRAQAKDSVWQKVVAKLKAFFVHIYVKESILKLVAKIRKQFDCTSSPEFEKPLSSLLEGVEYVVEGIIQENEKETGDAKEICLYGKIADDINSPQINPMKQLAGVVYHHLSHDGTQPDVRQEIILKVDMFTKMMWNWLNVQVQREQRKKDLVNRAVRKIKRAVVDLPALSEPPAIMEGETLAPVEEKVLTTDEPVICSEADEETSSDAQPAASPEDLVPASDEGVAFTTEVVYSEADGENSDAQPAASPEDLVPASDEGVAFTTEVVYNEADGETSDVHPAPSPEDLERQCYWIVTAVVSQIFKGEDIIIQNILDIVDSLTQMLVIKIQESNITLKMNVHLFAKETFAKKMAKAVQKKLFKRLGNKQTIRTNLLTKMTFIYEIVIETLMSCLEKKTNPFVRVFRTLCNIFSRSKRDPDLPLTCKRPSFSDWLHNQEEPQETTIPGDLRESKTTQTSYNRRRDDYDRLIFKKMDE